MLEMNLTAAYDNCIEREELHADDGLFDHEMRRLQRVASCLSDMGDALRRASAGQ